MSAHSTYSGFQPYYMSADEITTYWSNYNNTDINPIISQLPNINEATMVVLLRGEYGKMEIIVLE